jgi:hypothetical protein
MQPDPNTRVGETFPAFYHDAPARPRDDAEPRWLTLGQVAGEVARWAVRQDPFHRPLALPQALVAFQAAAAGDFDGQGMAHLTPRRLEELLRRHLLAVDIVQAWNRPVSGHERRIVFTSRYGGPRPEDDFIDLDALVRNIVVGCFAEADAAAAFDAAQVARYAAQQRAGS